MKKKTTARQKDSARCATKWCRNKHRKDGRQCYTCVSRKWRAANPIKYAYKQLKANCKRRKKEFDLTLAEFTFFCNTTGYIDNKGKKANCATIDRINSRLGYTLNNIQILTCAENSRKNYYEHHPHPF